MDKIEGQYGSDYWMVAKEIGTDGMISVKAYKNGVLVKPDTTPLLSTSAKMTDEQIAKYNQYISEYLKSL